MVHRVRLTGKKREQCDCQAEIVITASPIRNTHANQLWPNNNNTSPIISPDPLRG